MTAYGLMADLHCHNWSSFACLDSEGRNTRLMHIIHEIHRCCAATRARDGSMVFIAGDVFHTRGEVKPSVFNPLCDAIKQEIGDHGMRFYIMPGNHDLEGRESKALTSAINMLSSMDKVWTTHEPVSWWMGGWCRLVFVPWEPDTKALLAKANAEGRFARDKTDLIIHAGIDGVLPGMPDHGLTVADLKALGYRRVFAGHYHNHKDMGDGIYSIGAPTHQTWSDVGSRAGWLVVEEDKVNFFASHAPNFIDITGHEDDEDLPFIVDGHFVRARVAEATAKEVAELRQALTDMGALGSLVQSVPAKTTGTRTKALSVTSLASLDKAVAAFCAAKGLSSDVAKDCDDLLRGVAA